MKLINLKRTCIACPSQWEGLTEDNRILYARYRWGNLRVLIGEPDESIDTIFKNGKEIYNSQGDEEYDGFLGNEEFMQILDELGIDSDIRLDDSTILSVPEDE